MQDQPKMNDPQWKEGIALRCGRCGRRQSQSEQSIDPAEQIVYYCDDCQAALLDQPVLLPGYERVRELGRGGMGAVYLAYHRERNSLNALRVILPQIGMSARLREIFLSEVCKQASLSHPHIARLYDLQEVAPGIFCMAMEYVAGGSAAAYLARSGGSGLDPVLSVDIVAQALEGLDFAHKHSVLHRNIKDGNLLLSQSPDGRVLAKVADFGLAQSFADVPAIGITDTRKMTGTFGYIAPEQFTTDGSFDPAADLYSMGATLYRLLTGHLPHDYSPGDGLVESIHTLLVQPIMPVLQRRPDVPPPLAAIVERALERAPEDRFASAAEMHRALLALCLPPASLSIPLILPTGESAQGQWCVVLDAEIEQIDHGRIEALVAELRHYSSHSKLALRSIQRGSVKLVLDGSKEGFQILDDLFRSGQLKSLAGLQILEIRWLGQDATESQASSGNEPQAGPTRKKKVFYSYADKDEPLRERLEAHLARLKHEGLIEGWHSRCVGAGMERKSEIDQHLKQSALILLLLSPDLLADDTCFHSELQQALCQHQSGNSRVIPILLRPVDWQLATLAGLQHLPKNGKPVTMWKNRDAAWMEIAVGIRETIVGIPTL